MKARIALITFATLIILAPIAAAAPVVLPESSSAVSVNGTVDNISFSPGANAAVGTTITITAPNGDQIVYRRTGTGGATGAPEQWRLNGAPIATGGQWSLVSGNLHGVPADGTWTLDIFPTGYVSSFPTILSVAGKAISFDGWETTDNPSGYHQLWNWRSTCTGCTWTEPIHGINIDPVNEAPDEDPNNAVFFNDATSSQQSAFTLNYGTVPSNCGTGATTTINGAWLGASGTAFSQFIYRQGNFQGTNDLRTIPLYSTTTEENEGSAASGTDTKTIPYNNIAGTSYQFMIRTATFGESLGAVLWIPNGLCAASGPSFSGFYHDEDAWEISVSQAQCAQDFTSFGIEAFLLGAGSSLSSVNVVIYEAQSGLPRLTFTSAAMHQEGAFPNIIFSRALVIPTGAWIAVATADLSGGIGVRDYFDTIAFNVPRGDCVDGITNLEPVLFAMEQTRLNITGYLDHINAHLHDINANVNFTRGQILDAIDALELTVIGNTTITGNFTIDNATLNLVYEYLITKFGEPDMPLEITGTAGLLALTLGVAIIAISAMVREKVNYAGVAFGGIILAYGGIVAFRGDLIGQVLTCAFALYCVILYALEIKEESERKKGADDLNT